MAELPVTAVVVNYRSGGHLAGCLDRLLADRSHLSRVIVVDNASGDHSMEPARRLQAAGEPVALITSPINLGLAGGVNLALERVSTPYLAVLNPDVAVRQHWLQPLVTVLDDEPEVGVACPTVLMAGSDMINSAGQVVHVSGLGFNRNMGDRFDPSAERLQDIGGLHGAAFVIRTELLRELGGWDETGFLYHEDVALSWDVLLLGRRIVLVPGSVVEHDYHLTMYPEKLHLLERNRWALLLSHIRPRRLALLAPILALTEFLVWGLCLLRGPRFIAAKAKTYGWVWRNRSSIKSWRDRVFSRAVYDDRQLGKSLTLGYPTAQLTMLGSERGTSSRVPEGGLPTRG